MSEPPRCVYCRQRSADVQWRPFCSKRCKMADLGRWLTGGYRVPEADAPDGADAEPAGAEAGEEAG